EEQEALVVVRFLPDRYAHLDAQRAERREPPGAGAGRRACLVPRPDLFRGVRIAGVEEDDALQADPRDDREDDLVVHDELRAAADRVGRDDLAEAVLAELVGAERAAREAADGVDAAGEEALEERKLLAVEPLVALSVGGVQAQAVGDVAPVLRLPERV